MKNLFTEELIKSMSNNLDQIDEKKDNHQIYQAVKNLHSVATLLQDLGLEKEASHTTSIISKIMINSNVISKIAKKKKNQKKVKIIEVDDQDNDDYKNWLNLLNKKSQKEDTSKLDNNLKDMLSVDDSLLNLNVDDTDLTILEENWKDDFED